MKSKEINRKVPSLLREKELLYVIYKNRKVCKFKHITPPYRDSLFKKIYKSAINQPNSNALNRQIQNYCSKYYNFRKEYKVKHCIKNFKKF